MTRYTHALKTNKEELKQLLLWLGILIAINVTLTILLPFYLSFPLSLVPSKYQVSTKKSVDVKTKGDNNINEKIIGLTL